MKRILRLVIAQTGIWRLLQLVSLGLIAGLSSFLFISLSTAVIALIIAGKYSIISKGYIVLFAGIILAFVWSRKALSSGLIRLSQTLLWQLRKHILSLVLRSGYQQMENKRSRLHTVLVNDVHVLTEVSMSILDFITAAVLALASLVYLACISLPLFFITLVTALLGGLVYHLGTQQSIRRFERSRHLENNFLDQVNAVLSGFKEIYMEPGKGKYIYDTKIMPIAGEAYTNNTAAFTGFLNNQILGQILFYILVAAILLLFNLSLKIAPKDTVSFVFTLFYFLGSVQTIMALLPGLARAKVASEHLLDLQSELEATTYPEVVTTKGTFGTAFKDITIRELTFHYPSGGNRTFGIGPIQLDIKKGDTIFIYGGNGSGKTTFTYTLLGLYMATGGEIRLNNIPVTHDNYTDYRAVFSVVFSDFYLFKELVGIAAPDMKKWEHYLRLFELDDKITIDDNHFSTTDLSTGQRKRLALIASLLENKPVLVMDEWAADQDPYFRNKFYTEIIPGLKKEGFTIIAITHDDKYYHHADKLYKMDYGKLTVQSTTAPATGLLI